MSSESEKRASTAKKESGLAIEKISVRDVARTTKVVQKKFPGPQNADEALRVAVDRRAYADLVAHAKESLDVEVCGVLAGEICEDEQGIFVHVQAAIRGAAASEASTHVTFTQATWNNIHETLERDFPKLRIVGWYHTHPGFGVEFSDMDLFIQKNFFSSPAQIALVTDPLSGAVAICLNTADGAGYLPRFWVDGREQTCRVPERGQPAPTQTPVGDYSATEQAVRNLESRLNQVIRALDEQQASYHRFLFFCGFVFCLTIIGTGAYLIYHMYSSRFEPPKLNSYIPLPVQIGDKTALVGLAVMDWKIPDEMNALLQLEITQRIAAEKAAEAKAATNNPSGTNAPAKSQQR